MKTSAHIIAISAIAAFISVAAHASGEVGDLPASVQMNSSATAANMTMAPRVRFSAQAWNGSTEFMSMGQPTVSPAAVKAETLMAIRNGRISRGEIGPM